MEREHLRFVVVGSVDHGKSTLIGRFLYDTGSLPEAQLEAMRKLSEDTDEKVEFAFVLDHLEEERARHITIDTAQTFFSSETRDYVIIDAPGHKEFLKNMITGASQASAALLLLDVDEGLREQTHRHAFMLSLLGIRQLVVVLNKMDKVDFSRDVYDDMSAKIVNVLEQVTLDRMAIIPASALEGDNIVRRSDRMSWYDGPTVIEALDLFQPAIADESQPFRLPVQDVYEIEGRKIAVGKVASGCVRVGREVSVQPEGTTAELATLEKFEQSLDAASAGESIGFTLSANGQLSRGQTLCAVDDQPQSTHALEARVFWMSPRPLRKGQTITLRLATQELPCTAERIANRMDAGSLTIVEPDAQELHDTEVAEVTLTSDQAIHYDSFRRIAEMGRLVLMQETDIVGGGIVV